MAKRIPPARFGFDRQDPPDYVPAQPARPADPSAHFTTMRYYLDHTNLRIVGGYLNNAGWYDVLPDDWSRGWGVVVYRMTPAGKEWGTYRWTCGGQAYAFESPPNDGVLHGGSAAVQADAQMRARRMRDQMKALWPNVHRPSLFLDNEDSAANGNGPQPPPPPQSIPLQVVQEMARRCGLARTPNETDDAFRQRVLSSVSGLTREGHAAWQAIPWLEAAINELETPDQDGFAVRVGLYGHTNLFNDTGDPTRNLIGRHPHLLLLDPNYGGDLRNTPQVPPGQQPARDAHGKITMDVPRQPTCTTPDPARTDLFFFPCDHNLLPKPQNLTPDLKASTPTRVAFTIWDGLVQWVGNNTFTFPPGGQLRQAGAGRTTMDYLALALDDPLTVSPGPRFALDADGFLWRVQRKVPPAPSAPLVRGTRLQIADVTITELVASPAKPSPSPVPIGNALVHPAMAPVPVSVGNRRFALLAAQDATGSGVGVLRVERTGSAATAPQTVIGPDPNVALGAPITAASDGTDILVAGIGRDSLLRVARVSAGQVTSPATWQSTGIKCHPFSRVSLRARGPASGAAIIVDPNRAVAVARWEPATPWPPRTAAALPSSTALGTSPLCLAVSGGRFVILFIGADLKLYFAWEYSPGAWTTPNPVTNEILCPHSALAVGEGQGALEILALREDLYLQLYRLIPGVGATATPTTWFTPIPPATGGTAFERAPNPFGDLGAAQVGSDRIIVFQALVNPPRPATGSSAATRVSDVFGGVSYARQASPPTAAAGWVDLF